jgi:hypothetical protein
MAFIPWVVGIDSKQSLINAKNKEKAIKKFLKTVYDKHRDVIDSIHKNTTLNFIAMPISTYNNAASISIHKSPNYNRTQSSEYQLMLVDNRVAYARKSNHWGKFYKTVNQGSSDADALFADAKPDMYGRVGYKTLTWNLDGGNESSKTSQAGYIFLDNLL